MIARDKSVRAHILRLLKYANYDELSAEVLRTGLAQAGLEEPTAVIEGHLMYLEDKEYVETREVEDPDLGVKMVLARIKAKGMDLLEGSIGHDPGLGI